MSYDYEYMEVGRKVVVISVSFRRISVRICHSNASRENARMTLVTIRTPHSLGKRPLKIENHFL